nr:hypothetical transcript [Hymenolepis microstoma]
MFSTERTFYLCSNSGASSQKNLSGNGFNIDHLEYVNLFRSLVMKLWRFNSNVGKTLLRHLGRPRKRVKMDPTLKCASNRYTKPSVLK